MRHAWPIAAVVALPLAFVAGRWSSPAPPAAVAPAPPPPRPVAGAPPAVADATACERRLAAATALLELQERARVGTPVPFPCIAYFVRTDGAYPHAADALKRCDGWARRFDAAFHVDARFMTDDGPAEYAALSPFPDGTAFDDNADRRWKLRLELGEAELMDAWGGRELTELEILDEKIGFLRDAGEDEAVLAELEAKRAALAAP